MCNNDTERLEKRIATLEQMNEMQAYSLKTYEMMVEKRNAEIKALRRDKAKLLCLALHSMIYSLRWLKGDIHIDRKGFIGVTKARGDRLSKLITNLQEAYSNAKVDLKDILGNSENDLK